MRAPHAARPVRTAAVALALALGALGGTRPVVAGGGPQRTPADERALEEQAKREARAERAWKAQGRSAVPALIEIACGNDASAVDLVWNATNALAEHGAFAARAIFKDRGPCARFDAELEITVGVPRDGQLAKVYCAMAGPYEEPSAEDALELARWARAVADTESAEHALAVDALGEVLERKGMGACDEKLYAPMIPHLIDALAQMPRTSRDNIAGTFQLSAAPRDELVIAALAASKEPDTAVAKLSSLYAGVDLATKLAIVDALSRSGPAGARAVPQVIDFLQLTRDDEARGLALRALAAFEAPLDRPTADVVGTVVVELLDRVIRSRTRAAREQDGWALVGSMDGIVALTRSTKSASASVPARGSPAERALLRALAAPLANAWRERAARALLVDEARLSPAQRRCARETLEPPTISSATASLGANALGANALGANALGANALGANAPPEGAVSLEPPASCLADVAGRP